jgi:hypothetical protein
VNRIGIPAGKVALWIVSILLYSSSITLGGGITADVGLTPPVDRWIFRTQLRYMERGDDPTPMDREARMYAVPAVLAYGLRPDVTIIARQPVFHRQMDMPAGTRRDTGIGDFALISKWRVLRINRPDYIIGIAPTFGIEFPTGDDEFGSETWDALTGLFMTLRHGPLGADLNIEYTLNGMDERFGSDTRPGDVFSSNLALSYQFTLDENATLSIWPVLELTYTDTQYAQSEGQNMPNTGGQLLTIAPGIKFARQSFMLEALIQFPVYQQENGAQLEQEISALAGMRYLF